MKRQPIDRPLSYLSIFATALNGDLSAAQDQYKTLLPAKDKPSVLDDALLNRIIKLHEEKNEFIANYERQFNLWRQEQLNADQLLVLKDLEEKLPLLKETNDKVLKLAYDIQPYTIEKILAMDPIELALGHLSGTIKSPMPPPPKSIGRFLVFTDQACQAADLQLAFFFKSQGTEVEMKALMGGFFQQLQKRFNGLEGYGAKRLMVFLRILWTLNSLIGTSDYTIIQFVFEFYGFGKYYVLVNPNTPLVQTILEKMVNGGQYFFLALNPDKTVTTFKATIGQEDLAGLRTNFPKIQAATTTDEQYNRGLHYFHQAPVEKCHPNYTIKHLNKFILKSSVFSFPFLYQFLHTIGHISLKIYDFL